MKINKENLLLKGITKLSFIIYIGIVTPDTVLAQIYTINTGGTVNTCSGKFYDSGGSAGNYSNYNNDTMTFCSGSATNHIRFTFNSFNTDPFNYSGGDYMYVYDGPSTASPLIAKFNNTTTITSVGTCLTFVFIADRRGTSAGFDATISCVPFDSMTYVSSTVTHPVLTEVTPRSKNNQILRIAISTKDVVSPKVATSFTFNTNGTTDSSDIKNAKLWFTGTSSVFDTTKQFGSTVLAPHGTYSIAGNQALQASAYNTVNYFWLTYDFDTTATGGNIVDAECTQMILSSEIKIPTVKAPTGSREIAYNISLGGSFNACSGKFYDRGGSAGGYSNNEYSSITLCSNSPTDHIRVTFNSFNTDLFNYSGGDYMYVYDGPSTTSPLIGKYNSAITVTSVGTCLTFVFQSDRRGTSSGFSATISCIPYAPMKYASSTVSQPVLTEVTPNSAKNQIIQIAINTIDSVSPINVSSFTFKTTGTTYTPDIKNAKLWFTGTSNVFSTTTQFGNTVNTPSGTYNITGSQVLQVGGYKATNYFWLTYDLDSLATGGNAIDAECTQIVIASALDTPIVSNPTGNRMIAYNIATGGTFKTCGGHFYDRGGSAGGYSNNESSSITLCSKSPNDSIRLTFNTLGMDPFNYSGADYLYIYDGPNTASRLMGKHNNINTIPVVTSTGSCLTFVFRSDRRGTSTGWDATISCLGNTPYADIRANGPTSFCEGGSVTLIADSADTYLWSDSITTTRSLIVKTSGNYTVTTTTSLGKATSPAITVTVFAPPAIPVIVSNEDTLISSDTIGNQWYLNSSIISGATQQTYTASKSGTYNVQVTDSNKCSSTSIDFIHKLSTCITPVVTLSGNTVTSSATGTYQWLECLTNAAIPNETNQSYTPSQTGSFKVVVTDSVCIDTSACVDITIATIGIQQQEVNNELIVYPNPGNGKFIVSSTNSSIQIIEIYNVLGELIWKENYATRRAMIDISEQTKGLYFYRISADNNTVKTGKLIIQ